MYLIKWAILLSAFWLLLSGYIQPLLLGFGAASVAIVLLTLKRMDDIDKEQQYIDFRLVRYLPWLIGQIVRSSIQVTKLIWGSPDKVSPTLAKISAENVRVNTRGLYANSITLTPGTLSIDLADGEITVHALQKSSIDELKQGDMEKKITTIWGENK